MKFLCVLIADHALALVRLQNPDLHMVNAMMETSQMLNDASSILLERVRDAIERMEKQDREREEN